MTSCCICLNEIQKLIKEDFQCQTCNSGIICVLCFKKKLDNINISKYTKQINLYKEIFRCPCCREVNWKYSHSMIINCLYSEINQKKEYKSKADLVFLENYRLMKDYKYCMLAEDWDEKYERKHQEMVEEEARELEMSSE